MRDIEYHGLCTSSEATTRRNIASRDTLLIDCGGEPGTNVLRTEGGSDAARGDGPAEGSGGSETSVVEALDEARELCRLAASGGSEESTLLDTSSLAGRCTGVGDWCGEGCGGGDCGAVLVMGEGGGEVALLCCCSASAAASSSSCRSTRDASSVCFSLRIIKTEEMKLSKKFFFSFFFFFTVLIEPTFELHQVIFDKLAKQYMTIY